ncbi:MAG TPA: Uma2 family endonuclease [Tepidisphaeraceae bacterium]|jgi:Uma2 family endonuclease
MLLKNTEPQVKRWTREEFYELAERGYFRNGRVQLLDGEIIVMAPHGHAHARCITYLVRWAIASFGGAYVVRSQLPLNASEYSDPEPDVAVVPGPLDAYTDHPQSAALVIEASDSSVKLDRRKAPIYATAGVKEYWLVNLQASQIEIYRPNANDPLHYDEPMIRKRSDTISPLERPEATLVITEVLG